MNNGYLLILQKVIIEKQKEIPVINIIQGKEIVTNNKLISKEIKIQYTAFLKDPFYKEKAKKKVNDENTFLFEIKENESDYPVICGNNKIYIIIYNFKSNLLEDIKEIPINMNIFLILQFCKKSDNFYIISCDKGTILYKGSLFYINSEKIDKSTKISEKAFKNGVIINQKYLFFIYNENQEGYLYIYDLEKKIC